MAGTIVADTIQDGAGNSTSMDNAIYGSAKAWVNFNGLSGASPVVRASYNVSSVTRTGTGLYTVAFTNAFADANYSTQVTATLNFGSYSCAGAIALSTGAPTTTAVYISTFQTSSTNYTDSQYVSVSCFR